MTPSVEPAVGADGADLRLAVPAAATWIAALVVSAVGVATGVGIATAAAGVALTTLWRSRGSGAALRVTAAAACCVAGIAGATTLRTVARTQGPLVGLARQRAVVTAEIVVTSDPRQLTDAVIGARRIEGAYLVAARAERLSYAGQTWRLRHPIVVFGDSRAWAVV
ncbi:MAG: hypothetical protein ABR520_03460, partial [Mycobacteriales bacterium]